MQEMKICTICKENKSIDCFGTRKLVNSIVPKSNCKECRRTLEKSWVSNNQESVKNSRKKWKVNNYTKYRQSENKRSKNKRDSDSSYKLKCNIKNRINEALRKFKKSKKSVEYVGCNLDQLKYHIENQFIEGMSWENHGQFGWHIDHIRPLSSFDFNDPEQIKQAFHYTNLQPLWWKDNLSKSAKLDWKKESKQCLE